MPLPVTDTPILSKFTLYETKSRFYLVGSDVTGTHFRIAKLDRTLKTELSFIEDDVTYSAHEIEDVLGMINHGNKSAGGLKKLMPFYGIFGFVMFLEGYYMILITKRKVVALLGGHYIYHVEETIMTPISSGNTKSDRRADEARYLAMFNQVDTSKNFYFSYSYDITNSLQTNLSRPKRREEYMYNGMFIWNHFLIDSYFGKPWSPWKLPVIHGFVDQAKISVFGHSLFITLIARRSRHYAGARFLKRGTNDKGFVANDVETEQIVHDASTTTFFSPIDREGTKPGYTSFLQHRGSIPVFWSQDAAGMAAKPSIDLNFVDPFYTSTARHFNNMMVRYGCPIIVLNLVKAKEKTKRESILLHEFTRAINYLNQTLPSDKKIKYIAWDMARASKSSDEDVIRTLEDLAQMVLETTGFFCSGRQPFWNLVRKPDMEGTTLARGRQHGILRTNCVDCLDRTNAAQFVVGKCALGYQLFSLGVINDPAVPFDSDTVNLLNAMYHDHGDTIALQYGGSHLVNTMETYRKISAWTSHSRDMIESIRRYYSNSFTDAEKQDAINVFLGFFVPNQHSKSLWDLPTDYFLHNEDPRKRLRTASYIQWWDPKLNSNMSQSETSQPLYSDLQLIRSLCITAYIEYYRPTSYTSFVKLFVHNMMSTQPGEEHQGIDLHYTPFAIRPNVQAGKYFMIYSLNIGGVKRLLNVNTQESEGAPEKSSGSNNGSLPRVLSPPAAPLPTTVQTTSPQVSSMPSNVKSKNADGPWWTTSSLAQRHLDPFIRNAEMKEYKRYVQQFQPQNVYMMPTCNLETTDEMGRTVASEHPDYRIFKAYLGKTASEHHRNSHNNVHSAAHLTVDARDALMYDTYVLNAKQIAYDPIYFARAQLNDLNDRNRAEGYTKWLRTGTYTIKEPGIVSQKQQMIRTPSTGLLPSGPSTGTGRTSIAHSAVVSGSLPQSSRR